MIRNLSKLFFQEPTSKKSLVYIIGAVWEEYAEEHINKKRKAYMDLDENHKYFSSGNLLINCKAWREQKILDKLRTLESIYKNQLQSPDQDLLNKCFENNYKLLDPKYCYINQNYFFYNTHTPLIRHYNGKIKPWHINEDSKTELLEEYLEFWKYAKMTPFYEKLQKLTKSDKEQQQLLRFLQINRIKSKFNYNLRKE